MLADDTIRKNGEIMQVRDWSVKALPEDLRKEDLSSSEE